MKDTKYTLDGPHAARIAKRDGLELDDISGEVEVVAIGWTHDPDLAQAGMAIEGEGDFDGYHPDYYFDRTGRYIGPDHHGAEPIFAAAELYLGE